MLNTLIVGGDGVIGRELFNHLRDTLRPDSLLATTRKRPIERAGYIPFDLRWPCALPVAERVIFCTGINGFKACEEDPVAARNVNVDWLLQTAKNVKEHSPRTLLCYLSSSAAETHPDTVYGTSKRLAEFGFLELSGVVYRFGPVCIPGRHVYPNDVYTPISLDAIKALFGRNVASQEGLFRLTNPGWQCLCAECNTARAA